VGRHGRRKKKPSGSTSGPGARRKSSKRTARNCRIHAPCSRRALKRHPQPQFTTSDPSAGSEPQVGLRPAS